MEPASPSLPGKPATASSRTASVCEPRVSHSVCDSHLSLGTFVHPRSFLLFYYSNHSSPPVVLSISVLPLMHEHLGLNLGTSGPSQSGTANLPSPPQSQHQQAGPSRAPPPSAAPPGAAALGRSGPPPVTFDRKIKR